MTTTKSRKAKHLGRGLASLLGPITTEADSTNQPVTITSIEANLPQEKTLQEPLHQIPVESIKPNRYQPRIGWDSEKLEELAASIKSNGLIQPILVRPLGNEFELIAGERRLRAAKLAELKTIPAIVRKASDEQLLEIALIENIQRSDLNPIERAQGYKNYIETFSLTQTEAAERLGENRTVITNHLRILELPEQVKQMLIDGRLSMGHARAILALPTEPLRRKLANRALAGRLSVREVEKLVRKYLTSSEKSAKTAHNKPPHIYDLEDKLTNLLRTKVAIETTKNGQRGRIIIEFYSLDEFDQITERLGLTSLDSV